MPPLVWCNELAKAAEDHVKDIGPVGVTGPIGTGKFSYQLIVHLDGSLPPQRIARYANIDETWAESTCFGAITPSEVV